MSALPLSEVRAEISRRFDTIDLTIKKTYAHPWGVARDMVERVIDEYLGEVPYDAPDSAVVIARRAKAAILRDFVAWAGRMDEGAPGAFQHNSLVEAAAAMADFVEQGRLDAMGGGALGAARPSLPTEPAEEQE